MRKLNIEKMKTRLTDFILTGALLLFFGFQNCGYEERGHANTPAETPGSQTRVGVDTVAHPGNIDRDTIRAALPR
jgi:hypothetical protein